MTFEETFILRKIKQIYQSLDEAEPVFKFSDEEIFKDPLKHHTLERLFQLIVDTMIDINQHFIKELDLKISDDLQGTFYILGENKVLPEYFAKNIAPVVGLRNRIVHRYEKLNKRLFIRTFRKEYSDFKKYIKHIDNYLQKKQKQKQNN